MSDGSISQDEIDSILDSLTGSSEDESESLGSLTPTGNKGGRGVQEAKPKDEIDTENIPLLLDVKMKISVVLGTSKRPIRDVLDLGKGSIVELDRLVDEEVDVYINDQLVGKGNIVALDDEYGVKITRILKPIKKAGFAKK